MTTSAPEESANSATRAGDLSRRSTWLNRTVLGIGLASLLSDVGHEMATTAMPALLAALGSSSLVLGIIEGVSDGASSFAKLYSGRQDTALKLLGKATTFSMSIRRAVLLSANPTATRG